MASHLVQSRSDGTSNKYYSSFRKWEAFITAEGGRAIPAEPIHVALYLTSLIDAGKSPSVVQSAMYAIKGPKWAHGMRGLEDPTTNNFVLNLIEAAKRKNYKRVSKKDILSNEQLVRLCDNHSDTHDILVLRDLAFIVLCFSGFFRFDEARSLKCNDITFHDNYMSVYVSKSKTDQFRKGDEVVISKGLTNACPMRILKRYMECAKIDPKSGHFLFKPAYANKGKVSLIHKNKSMSYTRTHETVVARLKEVGEGLNLGLHSLRASGATAAARAKVKGRIWKRHGRWKGDRAKDGYIEDSLEERLSVTQALHL
ncbi:integrase/recombinase xerD homolog [Diadema setosum]|uniref:integrase/recombinase xerD homolog n=1 Tax=Diadema setosum TaxID=31175 RepID=UPI003B3A6DD3